MAALTFYFDRNFGKRFPEALAFVKPPFQVEYHHGKNTKFPQDMRDDEWLEICGRSGWIVFSHDKKFHSNEVEATAIKQHGVGCFYLPGASMPTFYKLQYFLRAYGRINTIASATPKPFLYRVMSSGRIQQIALP